MFNTDQARNIRETDFNQNLIFRRRRVRGRFAPEIPFELARIPYVSTGGRFPMRFGSGVHAKNRATRSELERRREHAPGSV